MGLKYTKEKRTFEATIVEGGVCDSCNMPIEIVRTSSYPFPADVAFLILEDQSPRGLFPCRDSSSIRILICKGCYKQVLKTFPKFQEVLNSRMSKEEEDKKVKFNSPTSYSDY